MSVSLEVRDLKVRSLDLDFHEVSWRVAPSNEDVLDYTFQVLRSESPSGPFDSISATFEDRYLFIDNVLQVAHRWRKLYYVIRVTHKASGDSKDFGPASHDPDPDILARELRRHMALLFREFAGRRCWVLPARTFGQRCFLPGTPIQGPIIGASRALYRGKIVKLTTKEGFTLTVTANHPVLTSQGFSPAQSICVGDYLVCYGDKTGGLMEALAHQGDKQDQPALAEDVFRALAEVSTPATARAVGLDFHGEAERFVGDVEVVGSYRNLLLDQQSLLTEQRSEFIFKQASSGELLFVGFGPANPLLEGLNSPTCGGMCGRDLPSLGSVTPPLPEFVLRLGPPAQPDSLLLECRTETFSRNPDLPGQLLQRGSGVVTVDQVIDVRVEDYLGHVFDFESTNGWIVASGIVTSNCECWNPTLGKRTRSGCLLCFDTGWVRGYMSPIESWVQFDPNPNNNQYTNVGKQQQSNTTARLAYYPALKPEDVLIEPENRRWKVISVNQTEHGRAAVHQEVQLHEIPIRDIEFSIPLNLDTALKDLWLNPSRNFTNPQTLESFENEEIPKIFSLYPTTYPRQR